MASCRLITRRPSLRSRPLTCRRLRPENARRAPRRLPARKERHDAYLASSIRRRRARSRPAPSAYELVSARYTIVSRAAPSRELFYSRRDRLLTASPKAPPPHAQQRGMIGEQRLSDQKTAFELAPFGTQLPSEVSIDFSYRLACHYRLVSRYGRALCSGRHDPVSLLVMVT